MSLDPDAFRAVMGRFASGVTIVTATDESGEDHGMTVSAFASVSLEPPLIVVCIDQTASMHDTLIDIEYFAINILASTQEAIARRFAATGAQRFEGIGYRRGENGAPILNDVLAYIECRRISSTTTGDHTVIIAETVATAMRDARPLLYYRGGFAQLER
ncbi:MAG TPA: flavin reductase family protein [Gemmatimonadaceae bacterium]|jgi:flavin reductase (DIM6/NTAB) family NADH-FMN oxidoreductase RutF